MRSTSSLSSPDAGPSFLRALRSLTASDAAVIEAGLAALPGSWVVDRHESYDGHLSLLIGSADWDAASYAVDRDARGLHLTAWQDDAHARLGTFAGPAELADALRRAVGTPQAHETPHAA